MSYEELLDKLKELYPEMADVAGIELLMYAEEKLLLLKRRDDCTSHEKKKLELLPHIQEYLQ